MGTDNLFHKRKARQFRASESRKAKRAPYERVLIVCEGEKTEPHYLTELRDHYGLNTANIEVDGECGSSPMSVFRHAQQRYDDSVYSGDAYDRVYCVIDKDKHTDYQQALDAIANAQPAECFYAINSVPCFEYWVLLHFVYTTQPFHATGTKSVCDCVGEKLRECCLPGYNKKDKGLFAQLLPQLEFAKANAIRSLKEAERNHTDNPSTRIHELVDYLQNLLKPKRL